MQYTLAHIAEILGIPGEFPNTPVEHLVIDGRKVFPSPSTLFIALKGPRRDGHQFIADLYKNGIRNFLVSEEQPAIAFPDAYFLQVPDTLSALQDLAMHHRRQFDIPVVGITGSNGKTIVKEWIFQLLSSGLNIVRSPKSYNSQVGVPLSVWQMEARHELAIFEAGISQPGEMEKLQRIIQPTLGILTNIGEAHNEGFSNKQQKLTEKLKLFPQCAVVIARDKDVQINRSLFTTDRNDQVLLTWGADPGNDLVVKKIERNKNSTSILLCPGSSEIEITIPFTDDASVENAICSFFAAIQLGAKPDLVSARMKNLHPVDMRLELKNGINHCRVINDSYSADLNSLEIALDFLDQQSGGINKSVILSDLLESGEPEENLYPGIVEKLKKHRVGRLIGIGEHISKALHQERTEDILIELYLTTENYLSHFLSSQFREEIVLVKGARVFGFERIVQLLELKQHQTVLEINLTAIVNNLKFYQKQLRPGTKIMAMVKAFAYGSGGAEIAGILQYHKVDYLGVAYADEGVELRKAGVALPIMVMNPEEAAFDSITEYNLEPDIYSFSLLKSFTRYLQQEGIQHYPVHIEVETGMNRLGFPLAEIGPLADFLSGSVVTRVQSVFSHLAASEEEKQDAFTLDQYKLFLGAVDVIRTRIDYPFLRHISNSAGILRHPDLQLDMVRLGIGMYGVDSSGANTASLQPAATLKTTIAQLRSLKPGQSIGYNRRGIVDRDAIIATVRIGYADGYLRSLGNGSGNMLVRGKLAPVIGSICMDMTMIDVTGIEGVQEGDDVLVFGKDLSVQQVAQWAGTIPYEIMTGISQRVKRVYFEE